MGDGHEHKKPAEDDVRAAMVPVVTPLPKPHAPKPGVKVDTDRAPTVDEILDPRRPAMDGADSYVIVDSISRLVDDLYDKVLIKELTDLTPKLAEVPAPSKDYDFVTKLLGWTVEAVATATFSELGGLAVAKLATEIPAIDKAGSSAAGTLSKDGGKAAGAWVEARLARDHSGGREPHYVLPKPDLSLAENFVELQRLQLIGRQEDAVDMLRLIKASAVRQNPGALAALDSSLKDIITEGTLGIWFRHKVTMEWLNFVARLSLGPRPEGQVTNMPGANTIGGIGEAGTRGIVQWQGGHDGFVEITIDAESSDALSVIDAKVSNRPGAVEVLHSLTGGEKDSGGKSYNLASIPVFRRIWLKTGDARFETTPAFVITPEGALEVNYDDPKLAVLGGGRPAHFAGPYESFDGDQRRDGAAWSERASRAANAMAGAQRVVTLLQHKTAENLK